MLLISALWRYSPPEAKLAYAAAISSGDTPYENPPRARVRLVSLSSNSMPTLFANSLPVSTPSSLNTLTAGTFSERFTASLSVTQP